MWEGLWFLSFRPSVESVATSAGWHILFPQSFITKCLKEHHREQARHSLTNQRSAAGPNDPENEKNKTQGKKAKDIWAHPPVKWQQCYKSISLKCALSKT